MSKELVTIERINELDVAVVYKPENISALIEEIRQQAMAHVPDISTATGRKAIASNAHNVARSKTLIDGMGKDLGADYKAKLDSINKERKRVRDECDLIKDEVRKPLTEWEEAEKRKGEVAGVIINTIMVMRESAGELPSQDISNLVAQLDTLVGANDLGEHLERVTLEIDKAREVLTTKAEAALQYEKDQAELAKLKKEAEERAAKEAAEKADRERKEAEEQAKKEQADREERIRKEAEEKAQREAAEKAEAEKLKAEQEKQEAIRKQKEAEEAVKRAEEERKVAAIKAEQEKAAAVALAEKQERERQEKTRREEDEAKRIAAEKEAKEKAKKSHIDKIKKEAYVSLVKATGISEADAKTVLTAINNGEVKHVTINY